LNPKSIWEKEKIEKALLVCGGVGK